MTICAAGCSEDGDDVGSPSEDASAATAGPSSEFAAAADGICSEAEAQLVALGSDPVIESDDPDPVREALLRPAARITSEQAVALRRLASRLTPTPAVTTYLDYFEVIDALLQARLRVGEPGGPDSGEGRELELRFQALAQEQSGAATSAGLPACAFDVPALLLGG